MRDDSRVAQANAADQRAEPSRRHRRPIEPFAALLVLIGLILAAALLVAAYLHPHTLNDSGGIQFAITCVAFFGQVFQMHIALACAAAGVAALAMRRWRLAAFAILVAAGATIPTAATFLPKDPPPPSGSTLRVHSMNLYFGNLDGDAILAEIDRVNADVLLVQEWQQWHAEHLAPRLRQPYPHQVVHIDGPSRGLGVWSRIPLLSPMPDEPEHFTPDFVVKMLRVAIEHEGRRIAIYNVHPTPPMSPPMLRRNRNQATEMLRVFGNEPLPVIAAGDFNSGTFTTQIAAIRGSGLTEAHALAGNGPGWTWPVPRSGSWKYQVAGRLPGIRIDHIFLSPHLTAASAAVGKDHGSDHRGVYADIGWKAGTPGEATE